MQSTPALANSLMAQTDLSRDISAILLDFFGDAVTDPLDLQEFKRCFVGPRDNHANNAGVPELFELFHAHVRKDAVHVYSV